MYDEGSAPTPQWLPPAPPAPAQQPRQSALRRRLGPLAVVGAFLAKFAAKLKLLLVALPKLKLLTTSGSMLVSVAAYALIWGLPFAAGFVGLLFIHEFGHYLQLRREGVRPSGMLFIPFLGAVVGARSLGGSALAEARVGLAGPVLGSLAAAALVPLAIAMDSDMLRALAFVGFFLNLFNLAPVVPLDGGRAMAALAPWMWFVGFGLIVVLVFAFPSPVVILIALLGAMETWRRWRTRRQGSDGNADYYRVAPRHRALVLAVYLLLIVGLAIGMDATFVDRSGYDF